VHPEVEELRPKLKELLYDCAVEIRATKAALYLSNGSGRFELVTEYGFRGVVRESAEPNDPIVDRAGRGKTAFFVNGVATEPRFSEILFQASTDRLLVAPIWQRGQLVGFIDMRDKAQKLPFEQTDTAKAQKIADRIVALFANRNLFGQRFISLAEHDDEPAVLAKPQVAPPAQAPPPPAPAPVAQPAVVPPPPAPVPPQSSRSVFIQRAEAATAALAAPPPPAKLTDAEVAAAREALKALLFIPGLLTATFSAVGPGGSGVQETVARSVVSDEAQISLQTKLNQWLSRRGDALGTTRMNVTTPFGATGAIVHGAQLQKVLSAPVNADGVSGLYLTVAFGDPPDRNAHEMLTILHRQLEIAIDHARQRAGHETLRWRVAEKLIDPDFERYPDLRQHSKLVVEKAEAFAKFLGMPAAEVETVRIVALVHDVGMRLLDYDRLYRKRGVTEEEVAYMREHARVGAALVLPLLGPDIARAVLCHHERVDGRGYPNGLQGEEIPLVSRLVQICDVYVAITDPNTYQLVEPPAAALATIARLAGTHLDAKLAAKFQEMMRAS
jgi:hypothetical protein